jgi:hypothetical protein
MNPTKAQMSALALFLTRLVRNISVATTPTQLKRELPSFTDTNLTAVIRRWLALILRCSRGASDSTLIMFTGYSLRVGGAVALHNAGADGMVIALLGQWKSDVYQLYIRTARNTAMAWTVRMGRGYKAKF